MSFSVWKFAPARALLRWLGFQCFVEILVGNENGVLTKYGKRFYIARAA